MPREKSLMKTLLILRHGKSSWKELSLPDHDRPLNKRGRRNAKMIGRLLASEGLTPELILSSTAERARRTARRVASAAGYEGEIDILPDLYLASPAAYLSRVALTSEALQRVMVVGHNPGLERHVTETTGAHERFPTAALAQVDFDIDAWPQVIDAHGVLVNLWRPREME